MPFEDNTQIREVHNLHYFQRPRNFSGTELLTVMFTKLSQM